MSEQPIKVSDQMLENEERYDNVQEANERVAYWRNRAEEAEELYKEACCAENALIAIVQQLEKEIEFLHDSQK